MSDLLGYQLDMDGRRVTVVTPPNPAAIPPGYVYVTDNAGYAALASAEGLRRHRQLSRQERTS